MCEREEIILSENGNIEYDPSLLEIFNNKHPENDYFIKIFCPKFTSLYQNTGKPDFASITISYVPDELTIDSKSLEQYLVSFRNHEINHEECINTVMMDLISVLDPKYIEISGKYPPKEGASINPYCNYGKIGSRWENVAWNRLAKHDLNLGTVNNR